MSCVSSLFIVSEDAFVRTAKQRQNLQSTLSRLIPADPRRCAKLIMTRVTCVTFRQLQFIPVQMQWQQEG